MFQLHDGPLDPSVLPSALNDARDGAVVTFTGRVRNHSNGRRVRAITYEVYSELARQLGEEILSEARNAYAIHGAECHHGVGTMTVGDVATWIGVSAPHRESAFNVCRYILDEVKKRVPIWKCEHFADGTKSWIHPTDSASLTP